jgi:hypothetical protein
MKALFITSLMLTLLIVAPLQAQEFPEADKSPMDIAMFRAQDKTPLIRVIYSRPLKNGREIFGKLQPFGEVWRTGANETTEIKLYKDMMIGDQTVKAGTYSLFTIPGEKEWTVILNKDTDTWGAFGYKQERDVVRVTTPARKADKTIEFFSMTFKPSDNGADLLMGWDNAYVEVPFTNAM